MVAVRQWLEGLGLERYAQAFAENDIAPDLLPELTDDVLKDIGVASAGHRLRLLKAAAALGKGEGAAPAREAERRQITVMFCDLVGSVALSEALDPEDLRALMQAYQQACGAVIARFEGHVAQYLGDGLMTYFGWPRAHEDDAERAVRAGLEIVDAVKAVDAPEPLRVRVGIATGPVVVGETGAGDASVPKLAVGETPNLSARLQGIAGADEIVIAPSTHRLVGGAFAVDDLGEHALKGIIEPVRAWRVTGLGRAEDRFEAAHGTQLTPLIGRREELDLLLRRWEMAKEGDGQVVLLGGEAGIGKSRITRALQARLADEPHLLLRYQCSPYHTNSAFYPFGQQVERAAGLARDDPPEIRLDKLEALLGRAVDDLSQVAPLFAAMLSIDTGDRYAPLHLGTQRQKEKTFEALAEQIENLSAKIPVLLIFEDAHWIDPTSQDALALIVARLQVHQVLVIVTYRLEYVPPWTEHSHVTMLTLSRLGRAQATAMIEQVGGGKALPSEILNQIVDKTDGVPLFVEELTRNVLESGLLAEAGPAYEITGAPASLAIPSTLQDALMARLDRLAPVRVVAQIGAAIGREFSYELIAALSPLADEELQRALARLADTGLIFGQGAPPEATYTFKHALLQDAAHQSLLRSTRQRLHADIARLLEARFPERANAEPEVLARHYALGELPEKALQYWLAAAQVARRRSANAEALAHADAGLELLRSSDAIADDGALEAELQEVRAVALMRTKGFSSAEARTALDRAREICPRERVPVLAARVLMGLFSHYVSHGNLEGASETSRDLMRLAEESGCKRISTAAHHAEGLTAWDKGHLVVARDHIERSLSDETADLQDSLLADVPMPAQAAVWSILGHTLWILGFPDKAKRCCERAVLFAGKLENPMGLAYAHAFSATVSALRCDWTEARRCATEVGNLARVHNLPVMAAFGALQGGRACIKLGDVTEGLAEIDRYLEEARRLPEENRTVFYLLALADTFGELGRCDEAFTLLDAGIERMKDKGGRSLEAEFFRLRGHLRLAEPSIVRGSPATARARADLKHAIDVARSQQARSWELRSALSLVRLSQDEGETALALDVLDSVRQSFSEGFDTGDFLEAETLLREGRGDHRAL